MWPAVLALTIKKVFTGILEQFFPFGGDSIAAYSMGAMLEFRRTGQGEISRRCLESSGHFWDSGKNSRRFSTLRNGIKKSCDDGIEMLK